MEFRAAQLNGFLKSPDPNLHIFLVYGQDDGLIREYGKKLALTALETLDDPFCYSEMEAQNLDGDPARLRDEIEAISMMGGMRVVRLRGVTNAHAKTIIQVLDADFSNTLFVIEAGDLKKTAALVKAVNGLKTGVTIACYHDKAQDISSLITEVLSTAGLSCASDVQEYLRSSLGSDRAISRQELDKLVLIKAMTNHR